MSRLLRLIGLGLLLTACASLEVVEEPPDNSTTSTVPATTTTSTTVPPTTTTTQPVLTASGRVLDSRGDPVAGAMVALGETTVFSSEDGSFVLETTDPGEIEISGPGWLPTRVPWPEEASSIEAFLTPLKVRGLRVGAEAAGSDDAFARLLALADETAVNAFVFDTKQEGGKVVYDTSVTEAHQMGAVDPWYDPHERLAEAREHGLYTITRIVVFEDEFRSAARPDEKLAWVWIDPRSEGARQYNLDLAAEACELGFDEIQFDYVRFPSGQTAKVSGQLALSQEERIAAIESFLAEAKAILEPMGCSTSAAIFAIVVSVGNDQGLGQRPEELSEQVRALSPMVYPSHYSNGWLGFPDPNDYPYEVTAGAIDDALPRLADGTILRPWLQAFWWSNAQIRTSIQAAEDRDVGWILWNVRSSFDAEALPTDDEVSG